MPLSFHVSNTASMPEIGNGQSYAITVAELNNDPVVAFLPQTPGSDPVYYMSLACDHVYKQHETFPQMGVTTGFAWDPVRKWIWCSGDTANATDVVAFDPLTETVTQTLSIPEAPGLQGTGVGPHGMATNGLFFVRATANIAELYTMGGVKLGQRDYPSVYLKGASFATLGWIFANQQDHELIITDPFGGIRQRVPAPGPVNGLEAVAFDYVTNHDGVPAIIPPAHTSTPADPTVPWSPVPWLFRHRIYVVNKADNQIYIGYLTGTP